MGGSAGFVLVRTSDEWRNKGRGDRAGSAEARLVPYASSLLPEGCPAASDAQPAWHSSLCWPTLLPRGEVPELRIGSKILPQRSHPCIRASLASALC